MKQHSLGLGMTAKRTRRREFLEEMERVVPWPDLVALVSPYLPEGRRGRPPFAPETMLRIHFMQQWCWRRLKFDPPVRALPTEI
jgi:transposase, IS5 family